MLENLGLSCSHTEIDECLTLLSSHGVKTVGFCSRWHAGNIDLIRNMIRMEGKEPCNWSGGQPGQLGGKLAKWHEILGGRG